MAKLRSADAYRRVKRPYTRTSKYRVKSYIKGNPQSKVVMFDMGGPIESFPMKVVLSAKQEVNLRHNAIEAARVAANRKLSTDLGKNAFHLRIQAVPHHIMRENPLATGAGADRFQQGMKKAFGKPIGKAALVKPGKVLFTAFVPENGIETGKEALRKASSKFSIQCKIDVAPNTAFKQI